MRFFSSIKTKWKIHDDDTEEFVAEQSPIDKRFCPDLIAVLPIEVIEKNSVVLLMSDEPAIVRATMRRLKKGSTNDGTTPASDG
jgi:hypothetical protein